jgi:ATP-dependent RNA helicase RhlE
MGFIHDVKKIITKLPAKKQTLFFSTTMPPEISKLAESILKNPEKVAITPVSTTAEKVTQGLYFVDRNDKRALLLHLLKDNVIHNALVFTRTKHGADKVVKDLVQSGIKAEAIHGNKSQNARQRTLFNFRKSTTRVLVATDIAARGIDIIDLPFVINYELPDSAETYTHRIGRTGRAGATGSAFSLCDREERGFLRNINRVSSAKLEVIEHPFG